MTPLDAMIELLDRMAANRGAAVLVNDEELRQWPAEAVKALKSQKLITKTRPSANVVCPGCEQDCVMPINTLPGKQGPAVSFIVCDKRADTNRVRVSADRLTQWQSNVELLCEFIAESLELRRLHRQTHRANLWEIGIATGNKRSQMLCLMGDGELILVAGDKKMPLAEVIGYKAERYTLDNEIVRRLVDSATTSDDRYTPSNARREARKLDTQAMYESWRKAYRNLKKSRKNMSDTWYSQQIAKMAIAQGRNAETIRKNMKK